MILKNLLVVAAVCALSTTVSAGSSYKSYFKHFGNISFSPVYDRATQERQRGAYSKLRRKKDEICYTIDTRNLPSGTYTNWLAIFNNPDQCSDKPADVLGGAQCGGPDFFNPAVQATMMWGGAGIVGADGKIHLSACYSVGELSQQVLPFGTGEGLLNPSGAEIQVVVRHHGPAEYENPQLLGEQLNSIQGNCANPQFGIEGFDCVDLQVVIHPAR